MGKWVDPVTWWEINPVGVGVIFDIVLEKNTGFYVLVVLGSCLCQVGG